ncbi:stage III sporulation protein AH [Desulfotomaculum arcticum]|uniref:Stage III sporulation protein AH n=1 Tax=Desulfotruncus arcticus DSM 17038 TaxID=1121424 RepID=A0A1I2MPS4_9FIRM|nr:SpoIIIAH-like family protein [Desulfotruncus arcticus]SFF93443.1 stage III sporulation protein AH [Desulfotomaculum arcticum] [Desulfotruncus arcticus DSM 17038]
MIKVIKVNRKKIALGLLALLGIACCVAGFSGAAQKIAGIFGETEPTSVFITQPEQPQSPSLTGDANPEDSQNLNSEEQVFEDPQEAWETQSDISDPEAFFVEYRMDRERARGKQVELLREVMASSSIDEETRKTAHEKFLNISSSISKEMELENLLRARGFQDAAVFLDGDSVTVVVQPGQKEVAAEDNYDLTQLVAKSTGVTEENVIIITKDF